MRLVLRLALRSRARRPQPTLLELKHRQQLRLRRAVLGARTRVLGEEHLGTQKTANDLASWLSEQGKYAEAERIQRDVLAVRRRVLGEEHPWTLKNAHNLAKTLARRGKYVEAEEMLQAALEACRRVVGMAHPGTLILAQSLEYVRSKLRTEQPSSKAPARYKLAAASTLSPRALVQAEAEAGAVVVNAKARAAETELVGCRRSVSMGRCVCKTGRRR